MLDTANANETTATIDPVDRILRPVLTVRVGITGDRSPALAPETLQAQVGDVLRSMRAQIEQLGHDPAVRAIYAPEPPMLRFISPLADGADRIAARAALAAGFALEVVMPSEQAEYEGTLRDPASVAEFRDLLAAAEDRVMILDGRLTDGALEPRSFGAAGRMVVRNCDLLIGIWDDAKPPAGRGGTSDTIHFALRAGVPVWWLHAARDQPARWLTDRLDLADPAPTDDAAAALRIHLARLIVPHSIAKPGRWHLVARTLDGVRRLGGQDPDPLHQLYRETPHPLGATWRAHAVCVGRVRQTSRRLLHGRQAPRTGSPTADGLLDRLAVDYQHRYRSSYFFVLLAGALALASAAVGLAFHETEWIERVATGLELVSLGVIAGLVFWNRLRRWQERYILYRMLRELFRQFEFLNALGWNLPVTRLAPGEVSRRSWVPWLFAAIARSRPLRQGRFAAADLADIQRGIGEDLLGGQVAFHERRREECVATGTVLGLFGKGLFLLTLGAVLAKIMLLLGAWGEHPELAHWLALSTVLLPVASAAFFGIRAYEELEVLAEQSEALEPALQSAYLAIRRIDVTRPLASQALGIELSEAAALMLSDVAGWAQLFQVKAVEAG